MLSMERDNSLIEIAPVLDPLSVKTGSAENVPALLDGVLPGRLVQNVVRHHLILWEGESLGDTFSNNIEMICEEMVVLL